MQRRNSRWESIPTRENPRFPRNVHRAKRDPPKLVRRLSSRRSMSMKGTATTVLIQNELEKIDHHPLEGECQLLKSSQSRSKRKLLGGIPDGKIRFDRKGHPIIVVRRSTTRTSCSDITVDSGFFSEYSLEGEDMDYGDDQEEQDKNGKEFYISEEQSLVDDDDDDDDDDAAVEQENPLVDDIPRILLIALEPYNASIPVHPSRMVAQEVGRRFGIRRQKTASFAVDSVAVLTDSQVDDDSRDDRYILAMAAIKKHIQRTQPAAVVVVTEDSLTSHMTVEGYEDRVPTAVVSKILEELKNNDIPTSIETTYGPEICQQWVDRFQKSGLKKDPLVSASTPPIVFLHIPPFLPHTAAYQYHPRMESETSVKGVSLVISLLASGLEQRGKESTQEQG